MRGFYTPAQEATYKLIVSLKESGLSYRRISKFLNERGIKTARGNVWSSPSVWSVIKKGNIRKDRLTRKPSAEMKNIRIEVED
jgi:hypothetical protein